MSREQRAARLSPEKAKEVEHTIRVDPEDDRLPLPQDLQTALLVGILTLMVFYTLYFAREIVMPILFAGLLNLLMQPGMRLFAKARVPEVIAAILMMTVLFGAFFLLFSTLAAPAAEWLGKLPQAMTRIEDRLSMAKAPLERLQQAGEELNKVAAPQDGTAMPVVVQDSGIRGLIVASTRDVLAGLITVIVVLFFLLISGDLFLRKLVEVLPRFRDKKQAVAISQEIERHISAYLITISAMNLLVGIGVGLTAYLSGLGQPLLWAALAFVLNYIPILGPMAGVLLVFLGGILAFDQTWKAFLVAGIYLGIHFCEGEGVTPMLLARRFTLNPVLVIISLIFWYWMWGVAGAVMAVPLLASIKIICDHVRPLMAIGHFIGG